MGEGWRRGGWGGEEEGKEEFDAEVADVRLSQVMEHIYLNYVSNPLVDL